MKILVTGAKGFIGKNLIAELRNRKYDDIFEYDRDTDSSLLDEYYKELEKEYSSYENIQVKAESVFFIEKVLSFLIDKPVWKCEVMDKLMLGKYLD